MSITREQKERAIKLLTHYLCVGFGRNGARWDHDNDIEVRELVDALIEAAVGETVVALGETTKQPSGKLEYSVIQAGDLGHLTELVESQIATGWRPQGGVASFETLHSDGSGNVDTWLMQAMVRGDFL